MEILVTGSRGFIGRNLTARLRQRGYAGIMEYDIDTSPQLLDDYARKCSFVFHLAGVNRPRDPAEYMIGNAGFTQILLESLMRNKNRVPVLVASSVQAVLDNPYGKSKKAEEDLVFAYANQARVSAYVYRLPNVFGKWCKPNYNSVVATFCHNIARGLPIRVNDPETVINLLYIDDVVTKFIHALEGYATCAGGFCTAEPVHTVKLREITALLESFRESRKNLHIPNQLDAFAKKLYSTYLSYIPENELSYPIKMHVDGRGVFAEFMRTNDRGQVSVNISKPGVIKGAHWHNTKNEKFLVVSGEGIICLRTADGGEVIEYHVNGGELRVVDIPPGYEHSIKNTGNDNLVTVIWASECYDPQKTDTYALEV